MPRTNKRSPKTELDPDKMPRHIAVIMDGNGRWATQRGLPRLMGHERGYQAVQRVIRATSELNIPYLTLYTFSTENWKRSAEEVSGLMQLIKYAAKHDLAKLKNNNVKLTLSGRINELPDDTREQLLHNVDVLKNNTGLTLNLAINYGGRVEIIDAVRNLAQKCLSGQISPSDINEELFRKELYAPDIPDPDLIIRTAGELRISNFLLWESAYSEIWVTPTYWPDFNKKLLIEAIADYQKRNRKFGAVAETKATQL